MRACTTLIGFILYVVIYFCILSLSTVSEVKRPVDHSHSSVTEYDRLIALNVP